MNLKSRLFGKPAWQDRDPEIRASAVAKLNDVELERQLPQLAQHDESAEVRLAALKRINTEAFWLDARLRESDDAIVAAADDFLVRAVMRKANPDMLTERLEWFARTHQTDLIRKAARQAPDEDLRAAALERIDSPGFLGDCYMSETSDKLAACLLERIDQESTLQRIIDQLRKTSKKRTRAAEKRLAAIAAESGHDETVGQIARRLVDQIEALTRGSGGGDRSEHLSRLEAEWQSLASVPEPLQRRFEGAAQIIRSSINRSIPDSGSPARMHDPETPETADPEPIAGQLSKLAEQVRARAETPADREADSQLLSSWDRAWNAITEPGEAELALREALLPLLRQIQKRHEAASKPAVQKPEKPAVDAEALDRRLDDVGQMLEGGELAAARSALGELRSSLDKIPARQRPSKIVGREQRMAGRLKEMRNWQHWSNNKIRDELIAQVEQLIESDQHPDAISSALKEARAEWQRLESLEVLPGDKRRYAAPPGQWRRFQEACKQAFEIARPFFEKREEAKNQNLDALNQFLDKGMEVAASENPDGGEMLGFMRKARQVIRRLDDIPPKARGKAANRLKSLMDQLSARLDEFYEEVESAKRRLVAEARELAHEKDLKTAIDAAKALQARWQKAGSGRRRIEQKLWKEFREPIDPLFEQLEDKHQERRQEQKETIAALEALCQQAEELAGLDEEQLPDAEGRMRGLSNDWHRHPHRPKGLDQRFAAAEEKLDRRKSELRRRERDQARQTLDDLVQALQAAWQQRLDANGKAAAPPTDLPQPGDDPLAISVAEQLARVTTDETKHAELEQQVAQNADSARQIVIEMEFLAGVETPEADRQQRMDYQVKRLARQLSERSSQPDLGTELEALTQRWYAAFPMPPEQYENLAKRFDKCRNLLHSMLG